MSRTAVRLCAQPGCTVPLALSAPFRFCNKHRKPNLTEAEKRLTHTTAKPSPPPPPAPAPVAKDISPEVGPQQPSSGAGHQVNRSKSTTQQGIDLLRRKIIRRGLNKFEDSSEAAQS